jgi:hypothetical protein
MRDDRQVFRCHSLKNVITVLSAVIPMGSEKPFLSFLVEDALRKRLDGFRFKNRFASRAGAIKWLLSWALDQKPAVPRDVSKA